MAIDSSLLGSSATAPLASRVTWPEQVSGFVRAKPLGVVGALIILVMLLVAAVAPALAPYDPYEPDYAAQFARPAAEHWFGTDEFGRDVLSRIMYGARIALFVGFTASLVGCSLGAGLGVLSAYCDGTVDLLLERSIGEGRHAMLAFIQRPRSVPSTTCHCCRWAASCARPSLVIR